ncbi:midasin isoform X2 [Ananas comosus]|uniref:Midasin n=1 Tax=Ananas comosus TaxID=4615 RepID=A0A6P5FL04_ANACO|nr:midasin isoform X2 [Ananas comosus]
MSLDGAFSPAAALRRLLARHPALRGADPRIAALEQKGEALTANDLVAALADPFLHPSYTIPIVGCFRPLCQKIVERAVAKLGSIPSLELESDEIAEEVGDHDVCVIDFYAGKGRGLRLHELASFALCRALDLAPFLLRSTLSYFKFAPPPFQRLILAGLPSPITEKAVKLLLEAARISYRFLVMDPKVFSELWDWSCFLDLVKKTTDFHLYYGVLLSDVLDVRWCSIQILSVTLKTSDRATECFGFGADEMETENSGREAEEAFMCLLRWEKFCMDTSVEKAGCYLQPSETGSGSYFSGTTNLGTESPENASLIDSLSNLHGIRSRESQCNRTTKCPFILTTSVRKSFEVTFMAVGQKWPVLLHGPVGAGKTALINRLAQITGNQVLFVHLDEQMDSKTLVGSYICTEKPGEFKWHPGSLTQAILKGFWIVFEDLDKAPNDIQSTLLPLLEGSNSFVTGHGEAVEVAESFRLFASITTSKNEMCHAMEGRLSFSVLWRKVMLGAPTREDMLDIVNAWHPSLQPILARLIDTFERVNYIASCHMGVQAGGSASGGTLSRFSLRDLLKWCKRITDRHLSFSGSGLVAADCQYIYQEAVDIFAASLPSLDKRLLIMREIASHLGVCPPEALHPMNKLILQNQHGNLQIGRINLEKTETAIRKEDRPFVHLRSTLHALERVACSIKFNEPVLLVGETGTGKTTLVQNLAMWLDKPLTVMNLSQQSDVTDLLGGFKPMDERSICVPLYHEFNELFSSTFSKDNVAFILYCEERIKEKKWKKLLRALQEADEKARKLFEKSGNPHCGSKRKRALSEELLSGWKSFSLRLKAAQNQDGAAAGMSFKFVEGAFITALRNGHWILLDEVNLAPPETLQRITAALDGDSGSLCLAERGDVNYVERHKDFRLFACMNPATDAGKRDLPYILRSRFTEYFVDDVLDDEDLRLFVKKYMEGMHKGEEMTNKIVQFYKASKKESEERLQDGANQKPQFSLRSLARALDYTRKAEKHFGFEKSLYDGFCMFFLTLLDGPSAKIMNNMILSHLFNGKAPPTLPFDSYLVETLNNENVSGSTDFVETVSVKEHLKSIARAIYIKRYPVLLQGPTSSGKTSLVRHLASVTGHEFVRINNHEHTDLQEYLGSYITDSHGRLRFQEGILVKAVRKGHWIVLDELNLAPSDVLEALNRLLDDNRQLFVPELQETITAHPDFMLFATQNPPMLYGGRKMLSRAFRNRFLEIHVDEIPEDELTIILEKRCEVPNSSAKKMVEVMKDLQLHRQNSRVFAGKHGFITPRDLFRWANRFRNFGSLAKDGYFLLAERLRDENEKKVVQETLERCLRVKLNINELYNGEVGWEDEVSKLMKNPRIRQDFGNITWTKSMWRLYFLVKRCYELREPVLLVGETGGGKTTVCQVLSAVLGARLHILNCHQYTETSDFIGGYCPVRDRSRLSADFKNLVSKLQQSMFFSCTAGDTALSFDISEAASTINQLSGIIDNYEKNKTKNLYIPKKDVVEFKRYIDDLMRLKEKWQTIFLWQDGPLVQAMKDGDIFLVDEISLADDSVLERLNSVLELDRKLSLPEKGGSVLEKIEAHDNFFILATMNPGGDYGKKELSPALRNRFTEIWVPTVMEVDELKSIAIKKFANRELSCLADCIINFWQWFKGRTLTIRDLLSWISFVNGTEGRLGLGSALIHGLFLVLLDGLSLGTGISRGDANKLREDSLSFVLGELQAASDYFDVGMSKMENYGWGGDEKHVDTSLHMDSAELFGIQPFYIPKGPLNCMQKGYEFLAPTTSRNLLRVLRAMQLSKPVLLEGSPGVGKTSLIVALAGISGYPVVRINLSEQTDMMDLLGSDLPVQGENGMEFSWSDGILLQALKNGSWVLLDELNLAPQSVLEGLNAILDHRAEVYIPELGQVFKCPPSFRVFACQNPSSQGGGRKGLPKSFLNRFTKVYVDELSMNDYLFISRSLHPSIPSELLSKLILFNYQLYEDTMVHRKYGNEGSPWEFNLRDVLRSCQIIEGSPQGSKEDCFLSTVYLQRMRTAADRNEVRKLFEAVFGIKPVLSRYPKLCINPEYLIVGSACAKKNHFQPSKVSNYNQLNVLPGFLPSLEAALHCLQYGWLCILVGPHSSGKTSLVRLLAQLTGNALNELNLSSGTDVSELLGCFEQYSFYRHYKAVISQVECYIDEYFCLKLDQSSKSLITETETFDKWFKFVAAKKENSSSTSAYFDLWKDEIFDSLNLLEDIIEQLKRDPEMLRLPLSWSLDDLNETLKSVSDLKHNKSMQQSVNFEWVSGDLIKAIECGEWVVLDNANLCNPSVLDRINSLVEPDGTITVNECGSVDGKPLILNAHPNFRMFLSVDPKHGEVSRAMRNRGVEIFLMDQNWLIDGNEKCDNSEINNVQRFLTFCGIPGSQLVSSMTEAHMYAKAAGLRLGIRITLLELARWVQLFQQLLMKGNQPLWSLQLSWEHTYLPSLGEFEGINAVMEGKLRFLTDIGCSYSLSLPGGLPMPHKLRNLAWYSKEVCVKRNCMYLEYLGAEYSSYVLNKISHRSSLSNKSMDIYPLVNLVIPEVTIRNLIFPDVAGKQAAMSCNMLPEFDLARANKMLFIAANWAIEQATGNDFSLYIVWFKWYGSLLQHHCPFFTEFGAFLEKEKGHPIWKCILECWREVIAYHKIDVNVYPLQLLSLKLVDSLAGLGTLKKCQKRLSNAIDSVSLLRISYQQWDADRNFPYEENQKILLESLQSLERKVLEVIVGSQKLLQMYSNLLEYHSLISKSITSSQSESLAVACYFLKKEILKLEPRFELMKILNLIPALNVHVEKPTLWKSGGHPLLPCSANMFEKVQELLALIYTIWPRTKLSNQNLSDDHLLRNAVLSTNIELRRLATEGVCLSVIEATKSNEYGSNAVSELEVLHKGLSEKVMQEQRNLELLLKSTEESFSSVFGGTSCCSFSPGILHSRSGFYGWLLALPVLDLKSFNFDVMLLKDLVRASLEDSYDLVKFSISGLLKDALDYSLELSSRCPIEFTPHQMLLWILDAWTKVDSVHVKIAACILEMWYNYHSSMWNTSAGALKSCSDEKPCHLVHQTTAAAISMILQDSFSIKDYDANCFKLRVASRNTWKDTLMQENLLDSFHSAADLLLKKILFVHKRHFQPDKFGQMQSILFKLSKSGLQEEDLKILKSLLSESSHRVLASLWDALIEPLLKKLYVKHPSNESLYNLGCAWLHIGVLRFDLLLEPFSADPVMKYSVKHSLILEKISSLQLESEVRQECERLAGSNSADFDGNRRSLLLRELEEGERQLQSKMVFRPQPSKYMKFRSECADFRKRVSDWITDLNCCKDLALMDGRACGWQVDACKFIKRLSEEFAEYMDLIQPVQVAVYEMKFGLSVAVSSALERKYLKETKERDIQKILAAVYSFMQFPSGSVAESAQVNEALLNKLVTVSSGMTSGEVVSSAQLSNSVYYYILICTAYCVSYSRTMDEASFLSLEKIFDHFTSQWVDMKSRGKIREDNESQYFKFRPRSIRIEDILEGDLSPLSELDSDGNMAFDSEEKLEQNFLGTVKKPTEVDDNMEEDWDLIPEFTLKSVVLIHNQLFGSRDLVEQPGICHIADEDRLQSFMQSYEVGTRIMKGLQPLTSSKLDNNLMPEHLLRLSLEYEQISGISSRPTCSYNIYKDPNPSVMFKMVKPVSFLQGQVKQFLDEWPEHPGLQRIFDITESLLSMPLNSPLSKALLGLQLLVGRAQFLQENDSKYSFKDHLQPIYALVSSWQKLEIECWPALLGGVQEQYEINAEKLWFPLRAVLHDVKDQSLFTIKSIEEFMQTSSVGEFKRRLQLVLAFHGQISYGITLKMEAYSSPSTREYLNILYNAFGYYVQFMPLVSEYIDGGRRSIEKELKELLKLYRWEQDPCSYASIENFRRTKQKMLKSVQKFNDVLQQPLIKLLDEEVARIRSKVPSWLDQKVPDVSKVDVLPFPLDLAKLGDVERFMWYSEWRSKAYSVSQIIGDRELIEVITQSQYPESMQIEFKMQWEDCWSSLEKICRHTAEFAHLWKHGTKNPKRRALANLLKTLEGCGLSKHRPISQELENNSNQPSRLFLQPSYNVLHLLEVSPAQQNELLDNKGDKGWTSANNNYFKCLAMMQQLQQASLSFSKDLDLEQVNRAVSFVDHLISVLCEQRNIAYSLSEQLINLRERLLNFTGEGDSSSIAPSQNALFKCMQQQKRLFDNLLTMSRDMTLLLGSFKNSHLSTCDTVGDEAATLSAFVDNFVPTFIKSKELLDKYLIGGNHVLAPSPKYIPDVVTNEMKKLVDTNQQIINTFDEDIKKLGFQKDSTRSVKEMLLGRFQELINKGRLTIEDYRAEVDTIHQQQQDSTLSANLDTLFAEAFEETIKLMMVAFRRLDVLTHGHVRELSEGNITLWKDFLQSYTANLLLDHIRDAADKTIDLAKQLVDGASRKPEVCSYVEKHLKNLRMLLDLLVSHAEGILSEFLDAHRTTGEMTHALAHVFTQLFSEGFGSAEELTESVAGGTRDATGTGMGEGEGINDVSDQIEDESQLLGCPEKDDGPEKSDKLPSDRDKGVEMDEDFTGDMYSVSEDSGDEDDGHDNEEEDINLESQMGETGDDKQVAGEKAWDKDEDENHQNSDDKYESGPSVKEEDRSSRELRAKDDNALGIEEPGENELDQYDTKEDNETSLADEDEKSNNDIGAEKSEAFEDPTGAPFPELEKDSEDVNIDETEASDIKEDEVNEDADEEMMDGDENEMSNTDDRNDEENIVQMDEDNEAKDATGKDVEDSTTELSKETQNSDKIEALKNPSQDVLMTNGLQSNMEPQTNWANSNDTYSAVAPSINIPSNEALKMEISMPDSSYGSRLSSNETKPQTSQTDETSFQIMRTNPFRSIGDAMEEWKERAKVSADTQNDQMDALDEIDDENADEYRYVSEGEKGTSQALGAATSDQILDNVEGNKSTTDEGQIRKKEETNNKTDMVDNPETSYLKSCQSLISKSEVEEEILDKMEEDTEPFVEKPHQNDFKCQSGDSVMFRNSLTDEKVPPLDAHFDDQELSVPMGIEASDEEMQRAIVDWKKYEMVTTRLSQELTEQLRLVLEPTLASKLQGDYRTGKRINMKKVIPYIASHFRKDKIWLRRTKPNKRDYQVVLAVDDSRSMSENRCEKAAIEALVTVCRALSQLEVGQFAVASFGRKGNIKLLHDFDQTFMGEAGVKMISSLSFRQDNTIADEPVVDLLKCLNNMLDTAVSKSRMPSGQNPLHQLILIISDGRFHEKENLRRCVRDLLNRRRMIAFILLDSPQDSIMDSKEASFEGGKLSFKKYMNSFPFPYYIVLKNIEALPRTLADLLRQWFELMQNLNE